MHSPPALSLPSPHDRHRMTAMRHHLVTATLIAGLFTVITGCLPLPVGGPCTYSEPVKAQASVESLEDGHVMVRILSLEGAANAAPGDRLFLPAPEEDLEPGDQRTILLRSRLTGSCNPVAAAWGYPDQEH